jgi:hypothetical protein
MKNGSCTETSDRARFPGSTPLSGKNQALAPEHADGHINKWKTENGT